MSDYNQIIEELLKSIHLMSDRSISSTDIDKTIIAQISLVGDQTTNKYSIIYNGKEYDAFSLKGDSYYDGEEVIVLVPGGNFLNKKIILTRAAEIEEDSTATGGFTQDDLETLNTTIESIDSVSSSKNSVFYNQYSNPPVADSDTDTWFVSDRDNYAMVAVELTTISNIEYTDISDPPISKDISSATINSTTNIMTITTTASHGFSIGNTVTLSGLTASIGEIESEVTILDIPATNQFTVLTAASGTVSLSSPKASVITYTIKVTLDSSEVSSLQNGTYVSIVNTSDSNSIDGVWPITIDTSTTIKFNTLIAPSVSLLSSVFQGGITKAFFWRSAIEAAKYYIRPDVSSLTKFAKINNAGTAIQSITKYSPSSVTAKLYDKNGNLIDASFSVYITESTESPATPSSVGSNYVTYTPSTSANLNLISIRIDALLDSKVVASIKIPITYIPDFISSWDGTKTVVNDTSILTPQFFAGSNDGSITGFSIGKNTINNFNGSTPLAAGIVGYNNNVKTFELDTSGNLTIGTEVNKKLIYEVSTNTLTVPAARVTGDLTIGGGTSPTSAVIGKNGTETTFSLDNSGNLNIGTAAKGILTYISSTGELSLKAGSNTSSAIKIKDSNSNDMVTIDNTGLLVASSGSYRIKSDGLTSIGPDDSTEYSLANSKNLVYDHSFELLEISTTPNSTYADYDIVNYTGNSRFWNPLISTQYYPGPFIPKMLTIPAGDTGSEGGVIFGGKTVCLYADISKYATSTTTITPSIGSVTLTTQSGKSFVAGDFLTIYNPIDKMAIYMQGTVTSYNSTTGVLVMNIVNREPILPSSYSNWQIVKEHGIYQFFTIPTVERLMSNSNWFTLSAYVYRHSLRNTGSATSSMVIRQFKTDQNGDTVQVGNPSYSKITLTTSDQGIHRQKVTAQIDPQTEFLQISLMESGEYGANGWICFDGVQLVRGKYPTPYSDEDSLWAVINGKYDNTTNLNISTIKLNRPTTSPYLINMIDTNRKWSIGYGSADQFGIRDMTAGSWRFLIDTSGKASFSGQVLANSGNSSIAVGSNTGLPVNTGITGPGVSIIDYISTAGTTSFGYMGFGSTLNDNLAIWNRRNAAVVFGANNAEAGRFSAEGNFGVRSNPNAWASSYTAIQVGTRTSLSDASGNATIAHNYYYDGTNLLRTATGYSARILIRSDSGQIQTATATTAASGTTISYVAGPYLANLGTSWTNSSDIRLKDISGPIENGLDKVMRLEAVNFSWKYDEEKKNQLGLIAQNVLEVAPEIVVIPESEYDSEGNPQYLGVNYTEAIPLLVKAIQELKEINDNLVKRIELLEMG